MNLDDLDHNFMPGDQGLGDPIPPLFTAPQPTTAESIGLLLERLVGALTSMIAEAVRRIGIAVIHLTFDSLGGTVIDIDSIYSIERMGDPYEVEFGLGIFN